jgi:hypothetical protein
MRFHCSFGYPDMDYLRRVADELSTCGVTEDMLLE